MTARPLPCGLTLPAASIASVMSPLPFSLPSSTRADRPHSVGVRFTSRSAARTLNSSVAGVAPKSIAESAFTVPPAVLPRRFLIVTFGPSTTTSPAQSVRSNSAGATLSRVPTASRSTCHDHSPSAPSPTRTPTAACPSTSTFSQVTAGTIGIALSFAGVSPTRPTVFAMTVPLDPLAAQSPLSFHSP